MQKSLYFPMPKCRENCEIVPGINHIWAGIEKPDWDLLVCEDASRLFRNDTACIELIETAVDNGMRVVCINDNVDTTEEGWQDRLREAAGHHRKANITDTVPD